MTIQVLCEQTSAVSTMLLTLLVPAKQWIKKLDLFKILGLDKSSSLICLIGKKIQVATGEKLSTFFYSKVYKWQYNEAMQFVLWVAQMIYLQAWTRRPIQFSST